MLKGLKMTEQRAKGGEELGYKDHWRAGYKGY